MHIWREKRGYDPKPSGCRAAAGVAAVGSLAIRGSVRVDRMAFGRASLAAGRDTTKRSPYYHHRGERRMSNIIGFLEKLGADAHLREAGRDELSLALADAQVEARASEAILARNVEELYALLGIAPQFCVQTVPRKEGEEEEEPEEEGDGAEPQAPGKPAKPSSVAPRVLAPA